MGTFKNYDFGRLGLIQKRIETYRGRGEYHVASAIDDAHFLFQLVLKCRYYIRSERMQSWRTEVLNLAQQNSELRCTIRELVGKGKMKSKRSEVENLKETMANQRREISNLQAKVVGQKHALKVLNRKLEGEANGEATVD